MLEIETTKAIVLVAVEGILLFCGRLGGKIKKKKKRYNVTKTWCARILLLTQPAK